MSILALAVWMNASTSAPGRRETIAGSPLMISGAISSMRSGVTTAPRPGLASKVSLMIAVPTMRHLHLASGGDVAERHPITDREVEIVQRQRADGDLPRGGRRAALVDGQRRCLLGDALDRDERVDPSGLVPDPEVRPRMNAAWSMASRSSASPSSATTAASSSNGTPIETSHGAPNLAGVLGAGRRGSRRATRRRRWRRPRRRR